MSGRRTRQRPAHRNARLSRDCVYITKTCMTLVDQSTIICFNWTAIFDGIMESDHPLNAYMTSKMIWGPFNALQTPNFRFTTVFKPVVKGEDGVGDDLFSSLREPLFTFSFFQQELIDIFFTKLCLEFVLNLSEAFDFWIHRPSISLETSIPRLLKNGSNRKNTTPPISIILDTRLAM